MLHRFPIEERHAKTREHRVTYDEREGVRYAYVHVVTKRVGRVVTGCVIYDEQQHAAAHSRQRRARRDASS